MTNRVLSIIPARGGSKGIPKKNIIDLNGKPLIAWTIEASLNSKYITKTIVSSDSDEILSIASKFNADTLKRPVEYATDIASSEVVVKHILESLVDSYDYIILLQPTSPLRTNEEIDEAFEKLLLEHGTALISVNSIDNKILKAFIENESGFITGIANNEYPFKRRQDLPKTYISNGAIYIISVEDFVQNYSFYTEKTVLYEMNEIKSKDIDTEVDLDIVRRYMNA